MQLLEQGSIWEDDAAVLVVPVNCASVMVDGMAKEAKHRFPDLDPLYRQACRREWLAPGHVLIRHRTVGRPYLVAFAATQNDWREPSRLEWIASICSDIARIAATARLCESVWGTSWAVPALGSGLGGLAWPDVLAIMERTLADVDARVYPPADHDRQRVAAIVAREMAGEMAGEGKGVTEP